MNRDEYRLTIDFLRILGAIVRKYGEGSDGEREIRIDPRELQESVRHGVVSRENDSDGTIVFRYRAR